MRDANLSGNGSDIDDPAPSLLQKVRQHRFAEQIGSREIQRHCEIPIVIVEFARETRTLSGTNSSVIDQTINSAKRIEDLAHQRLHSSRVSHVGLKTNCTTSQSLYV